MQQNNEMSLNRIREMDSFALGMVIERVVFSSCKVKSKSKNSSTKTEFLLTISTQYQSDK